MNPDERRKVERELCDKIAQTIRNMAGKSIDHLRRSAARDNEPQNKSSAEFYGASREECIASIIEMQYRPLED